MFAAKWPGNAQPGELAPPSSTRQKSGLPTSRPCRFINTTAFIVTNLQIPNRAVVRFYNKRGKAEQWIKEGKQAVKMARLSCHRF